MGRYVYGNLLLFLSLFHMSFLFFPTLVFPQLSSNQASIMITLSNHLQSTSSSWNASKEPNPCSWNGVTCSPDNLTITHLSLSGIGISDPDILSTVCRIDTLQSLNVSNNKLGTIPSEFINGCGKIEGLKLLNFSKNGLQGLLPTFHGFTGLEILDLSFNSLNGDISSQFDELLALKSLNLSFNYFTTHIPAIKSNVLEELVLAVNSFHGTIPSEIANYKNLTLIDLSANNLSGSIPASIGNLAKLKVLILSVNDLSGNIPQTISDITTLSRFAANQNKFFGAIPSGITRYLSLLDLSYNSLSDSIPSDLLSYLNLQTVDLSYNRLEGSIPANISRGLVRLRLGSNHLNGLSPSSFSEPGKLMYLELDNNSLTGEIPSELGSCQTLALLNLAQNNLRGTLPVSLGNLRNLQVLQLQMNKLSGNIPAEFTQLKLLSTLNISFNSLNGSIPSSISNLQNLAHLHLQGNNLRGSIPDTINGMNKLIELQLGTNQLSGRIPMMPPRLQIALNLSSNIFKGPIPSTLSSLKDLEILDLSNNEFTGLIPEFLTTLGSLTQLILSNNQLSGEIPEFPKWVSISVTGNNLINRTAESTPVSAKKKKSITLAVVLSVVAAVITIGGITLILFTFSRRFLKVNDQQSQTGEETPQPQVIQGNLLTANGIHRSNIDFDKAMEAAADPWNIVVQTRFSTYYKATMPSGAKYLVKKLNWSDKIFQLGSHDKFGQELEVLGKLSNSNVMTPLAYVLSVDSAYLFYEFAQKGSLFDALHGKLGEIMDWPSRYSIAVGVAQGLTFLHGCIPGPVLLLDLSNKNILLKSLKEPLVGDIELCKVIDPSKSTGSLSTVAGSVGYVPPEYAYTMRVTTAGNVYSFGVILLELLTGKPAVSHGTELAKWVSSNSQQEDRWDHILDFKICRSSVTVRSQMLAVLKVALNCVSVSPETRPKMKSVLRMILNAR